MYTMCSDACHYLLCHLDNWRDASPVQVAIVLASFDEQVVVNVILHLFTWSYEMVVPAINFIVASWSRCVYTMQWTSINQGSLHLFPNTKIQAFSSRIQGAWSTIYIISYYKSSQLFYLQQTFNQKRISIALVQTQTKLGKEAITEK